MTRGDLTSINYKFNYEHCRISRPKSSVKQCVRENCISQFSRTHFFILLCSGLRSFSAFHEKKIETVKNMNVSIYSQDFTTVVNYAVKSLAFYSGKNDRRDQRFTVSAATTAVPILRGP